MLLDRLCRYEHRQVVQDFSLKAGLTVNAHGREEDGTASPQFSGPKEATDRFLEH